MKLIIIISINMKMKYLKKNRTPSDESKVRARHHFFCRLARAISFSESVPDAISRSRFSITSDDTQETTVVKRINTISAGWEYI